MVFVGCAISTLDTTGRSKTEELGEDKEVAVESHLGIRRGLLGKLGCDIDFLLLELLRQGLLLLGKTSPVFLVNLLVLSQLLLELEELGLQLRLLEVGGLLVGVDDLEGYELVERLAGVFGNKGVGFGNVGLGDAVRIPSQ